MATIIGALSALGAIAGLILYAWKAFTPSTQEKVDAVVRKDESEIDRKLAEADNANKK